MLSDALATGGEIIKVAAGMAVAIAEDTMVLSRMPRRVFQIFESRARGDRSRSTCVFLRASWGRTSASTFRVVFRPSVKVSIMATVPWHRALVFGLVCAGAISAAICEALTVRPLRCPTRGSNPRKYVSRKSLMPAASIADVPFTDSAMTYEK